MQFRGLNAWRNRNVRLAMFFTAAYALSSGLWGTSVLSGYLIEIPPKKNWMVGLAEGLQGTMQALIALPSGALADKSGRQTMLRYAAIFGGVAVLGFYAALSFGAWMDSRNEENNGLVEYLVMCLALSLYGMFDGTSSGSLEALFHDSVETSERPAVTTTKFVTNVGFRAAGPLLSAVLFYAIGDSWTRPELRTVFLIGISLTCFPIAALFFFRDSDTLGQESDAIASPGSPGSPFPASPGSPFDQTDVAYELPDPDADVAERRATLTEEALLADAAEEGDASLLEPLAPRAGASTSGQEQRERIRAAKRNIPRIVLCSDILFGIASGTTIKFFPLFFRYETGLTPANVNWIYVATPLLVVTFSLLATRASRHFGRVRVPLFCSTLGICLLVIMWYMGQIEDKRLWRTPSVIIPIYVVRTALMNCASPIRKSILMDFVDKEQRGWWNGMDSVTRFSWSGSAVFGGILCDRYGYGASFLLTAGLQALALLTLSQILFYRDRIDSIRHK